jgi:hypothetical protein
MMNVLAKDLDWNAQTKRASVEASSLFGRSLPNSFNAYNGKTNKAATFIVTPAETEKDRDQDVVFWVYRPSQDTLLRHPNLKGWKVIVYND